MAEMTPKRALVLKALAQHGPLSAVGVGEVCKAARTRARAADWAREALRPLAKLGGVRRDRCGWWWITSAGREALAAWEREHG